MKKMKCFLFVVLVMVLGVSESQNISNTIQPGCFYRLIDKGYDIADSLFYNAGGASYTADTSWKPTYYNGNRAICKGVWVARGSSTGFVRVHPTQMTDTTAYYDILIDSTSDAGYPIPFLFDKIFWNGTTVQMDSVGYFPDIGK
jgi:hypothetical protein